MLPIIWETIEMFSVAVVDYDCGNMFSIMRVLEKFSVKTSITRDPDIIAKSDKLILPGVGAYGEGIKKLRERGLAEAVKDFAKSGKSLLGICRLSHGPRHDRRRRLSADHHPAHHPGRF